MKVKFYQMSADQLAEFMIAMGFDWENDFDEFTDFCDSIEETAEVMKIEHKSIKQVI